MLKLDANTHCSESTTARNGTNYNGINHQGSPIPPRIPLWQQDSKNLPSVRLGKKRTLRHRIRAWVDLIQSTHG